MTLQQKEISAYEAEYQSVIERPKQEMPPFKEAGQLLELVQAHFSFATRCTQRPKVIVLGSGFSEELIYAFGTAPYCAPLLLMIGYSFTLPVSMAGITGVAFSLASMASPVLLLTVITGALSKKMRQEIPGCIKWFQLGSYLLLIAMPFVITI